MTIEILMPALSPTMEEGNLAKWHIKEGDAVTSGDVIAEIETDKATMEVEAVDEGTVGKILVGEGTEGVRINEIIAVLLEEGEDADAIGNAAGNTTANTETKADSKPEDEKVSAKPAVAPPVNTGAVTPVSSGSRIPSSPLARRLASLNGIDISKLTGSGPNGRIIKRDVDSAISSGIGGAAVAKGTGAGPVPDDSVLKLYEPGSYQLIPHDNMRKTIARRLTEAKQQVPHFYLTIECEIDALLSLRSEINAGAPTDSDGNPAYKLSVNDMVIKAHALALKSIPEANASWSESGMVLHNRVDVGVAVAIEGGLITPIIRNAEDKPLSGISKEMKDMAGRARDRKLLPHEYQGGSTAVSNLGMFGIKEFSAVINPPHATILAVGAGLQQAVVKNGEVVPATVMTVTLSTDHRAVDGALGARLLQEFKTLIEKPYGLLMI